MANFENESAPDPKHDFYRKALDMLTRSKIPYLVGGAYALGFYTGILRDTKDLDVFVKTSDCLGALHIFEGAGFQTELTYSHWLAKACWNDHLVDIIFSSGNALSEVDELWFENAAQGELFGFPVRFIPPEEMIWSKGLVMERERYDGADVNHILLACAKNLDWKRLLKRFGPYWRVLLSHLVLFGFAYPGKRGLVPEWVMRDLLARMETELENAPGEHVCLGTLLSRTQYKIDTEQWGFRDHRLQPFGKMTKKQIREWDAGAPAPG